MLQWRGTFTLLCMVNWVTFWKECFLTVSIFHVWGTSNLCNTAPFNWIEKHCSFLRNPLMLETRWFSSMFSIENWVCCLKESVLPLSFSMDEDHNLCAKSQPTSDWEKNCSFLREPVMLETTESSNLVSIVKSVCSFKEYCLPLTIYLDE
jgi:hypothetical protein